MNLSFTTDKLQVVLGAAKTTNDMQVSVFYYDVPASEKSDNSEYRRGRQFSTTDGTAEKDILSGPSQAGTVRNITYLGVYNADTATKDVTIMVDDNTTNRILKKAIALAVGATLSWSEGSGWQVG